MKSASFCAAAWLGMALLAGCSSFGGAPAAEQAPAQSAPAATKVNPALSIAVTQPAVDPQAQRAFDNALQAMRAGRSADAERMLKQLAQSNPELGGVHANLGLLYRQAGKLPEAAAEFEQAVQASPKQAAYRNQLGITYRQMGRFNDARDAYEAALAIDPRHSEALLNLAILNDIYLWNGTRALELYERYLALAPGGDAMVTKWVADLKHRMPAPVKVSAAKEAQ